MCHKGNTSDATTTDKKTKNTNTTDTQSKITITKITTTRDTISKPPKMKQAHSKDRTMNETHKKNANSAERNQKMASTKDKYTNHDARTEDKAERHPKVEINKDTHTHNGYADDEAKRHPKVVSNKDTHSNDGYAKDEAKRHSNVVRNKDTHTHDGCAEDEVGTIRDNGDTDTKNESTNTVEKRKPQRKKKETGGRYCMQNSTTAMILLNNRSKRNRLKRTKPTTREKSSERKIDPARHSREFLFSSQSSLHHERCFDSSTPKFQPLIVPNLSFPSRSRSSSTLHLVTNAVNPRRHRSCRSTVESQYSTVVAKESKIVRPKSLDFRFSTANLQ